MIRRSYGRTIYQFGRRRLVWTSKNWRSKPHPFWYWSKFENGGHTLQIMRFEYFCFAKNRVLR